MLLQHAIKYHEACDWIRLQDPTTLTYKTLFQHCKQLEQCCEQYKKTQQKGRAELTTLANASVTHTLIHQDAISTHTATTHATDAVTVTLIGTAQQEDNDATDATS